LGVETPSFRSDVAYRQITVALIVVIIIILIVGRKLKVIKTAKVDMMFIPFNRMSTVRNFGQL